MLGQEDLVNLLLPAYWWYILNQHGEGKAIKIVIQGKGFAWLEPTTPYLQRWQCATCTKSSTGETVYIYGKKVLQCAKPT